MPSLNLSTLARQQGKRRNTTLRPIATTQAQAQSLAAILVRVTNVWKDAIPRILAGYDPRPIGDKITVDAANDMRQAIEATESEVSRLVIGITAQLRDWSLRLEKWHRGKWTGAVLTATNVDLSTVLTALPVQETLDSWLERNVALVRDVSAQTRGRIAETVFREYQNRTPAREVGKMLNEATGLGRKRAVRIAAHQTANLASQLDDERMAEAGLDMWKYRHSGKLHPRSHHKARDGKIYYLKSNKQVDGTDVIAAGDGPGQPPACGCRKQAYLRLQDQFGL